MSLPNKLGHTSYLWLCLTLVGIWDPYLSQFTITSDIKAFEINSHTLPHAVVSIHVIDIDRDANTAGLVLNEKLLVDITALVVADYHGKYRVILFDELQAIGRDYVGIFVLQRLDGRCNRDIGILVVVDDRVIMLIHTRSMEDDDSHY